MPDFTFYMHDGPKTVPSFEIEQFDTRAEAVAHGRRLLESRPRYVAIIITDGDEEIADLKRQGLRS